MCTHAKDFLPNIIFEFLEEIISVGLWRTLGSEATLLKQAVNIASQLLLLLQTIAHRLPYMVKTDTLFFSGDLLGHMIYIWNLTPGSTHYGRH